MVLRTRFPLDLDHMNGLLQLESYWRIVAQKIHSSLCSLGML